MLALFYSDRLRLYNWVKTIFFSKNSLDFLLLKCRYPSNSMSMCFLFIVVTMRDLCKYNVTLRTKAQSIFILIHVVTYSCSDFLTPRLIDRYRYSASIGCIYLPYHHSLKSLVNFHNYFVEGMFSHYFFDCVALLKGMSQVTFSVRV